MTIISVKILFFPVIETANCYKKFKIPISTEEYNETQDGLTGYLVFTLKETYPDIAPVVEIEDENFENDVKTKILENLEETVRIFHQWIIFYDTKISFTDRRKFRYGNVLQYSIGSPRTTQYYFR